MLERDLAGYAGCKEGTAWWIVTGGDWKHIKREQKQKGIQNRALTYILKSFFAFISIGRIM